MTLLDLSGRLVNGGQIGDVELPRHGRQLEQDDGTDTLADERAANGRGHADVAFLELDRIAEDQMEGLGCLRLLILHDDPGAEPHSVERDLGHVDRRELAQALVELTEASLDELLALERGLVLAVLTQVAHLDRPTNLVGERDVELVLETRSLQRQLFLQFFNHGSRGCDDKYGAPGLVSRALSLECMPNPPKKQFSLPRRRRGAPMRWP